MRGAFFRSGRALASVAKNYFFVDTNVIVGFHEKQYTSLRLEEFVKYPGHELLYTETVLAELQASQIEYPECDPTGNRDKHFRFVNSKVTLEHKESTIDMLYRMWQIEFKSEKSAVQKGFGLNTEQLSRFRKDLFIVFEACYSCHAKGTLPEDDFRTPPLVTNNMVLLNKFLVRPRTTAVLEKVIGLSGLERLIPIQLLEDTIEGWRKELEDAETAHTHIKASKPS